MKAPTTCICGCCESTSDRPIYCHECKSFTHTAHTMAKDLKKAAEQLAELRATLKDLWENARECADWSDDYREKIERLL